MTTAIQDSLPKAHAVLQRGLEQRLHIGAQVYVSLKGVVVVNDAVGLANIADSPAPAEPANEALAGRTLRPDDLVLWLSASKPVGAVAIAQSWEHGKVELDSPVVAYIPEFAQGGKEGVTLRHLLTHTGGFRIVRLHDFATPWEEIIAKVCAAPLEDGWTPGERLGYHERSSWYVLAEVVRRVDGRDYGQYVRQEIFEPLGMNESWIGLPKDRFDALQERVVPTYATDGGKLDAQRWHERDIATACFPAGNGRGPMAELGRLYEALLNGGERGGARLLEPATVEELTRIQVSMRDETFQHRMNWGLGFIIDSKEFGVQTVPYGYGKHCSPRTFGHGGRQSVGAFADPDHGLAVAVMFNGQPGEPKHNKRIRDFATALYEDLGLA